MSGPRIATDWVPEGMEELFFLPDPMVPAQATCYWDLGNQYLGGGSPRHRTSPSTLRARALRLADHGGGRLVLISDAIEHLPPGEDNSDAEEQEATLLEARRLASYLAPRGVRINICRVGYCPALGHRLPEAELRHLRSFLAIRRDVTRDDLAATIRFLAQGPENLVGETLTLDGGLSWPLVRAGSGSSRTAVFEPEPGGPRQEDETVLVTGASSKIGRAIVERLADQGCSLVLSGRSEDNLTELAGAVRERGLPCRIVPADLSQPGGAEQLWAELAATPVTGVVYGAGALQLDPPSSAHERQQLFQLNHLSWATLAELAAESWRAAERPGALVALGSLSADTVAGPRLASYAASKAAMVQQTSYLAVTYGRYGIRAGAVLPGGVADTTMAREQHDSYLEAAVERVPTGRFSTPDEVAAVVSYLLRPGSAMLAGRPVRLCGGVSTLRPAPPVPLPHVKEYAS